jgi:thioredoxin reductase (NADPH)
MEIYDVVIIGSGPAGLTAGIYTSRANLKTMLIAGDKWGGQLMLTTEVENYPGFPEGITGPELMLRMRKQAERFGTKIVDQNMTEFNFSKRPFEIKYGSELVLAKSVIVSTGAETRWLGLPNEQKLIGRGVSSCAPCDAPFFRNKRVIVAGGGDSAMEEALVLTKFATEVLLVHRRAEFRASKIMVDRVLNNPKIKIISSAEIIDILGENKVQGVKLKSTIDNSEWEEAVDGVFVAIGHIPACKIFDGFLELDEKGYMVKKTRSMSSIEGVFTAGDVHDHQYRQAITAAGYGCEAALEAERWLTDNE